MPITKDINSYYDEYGSRYDDERNSLYHQVIREAELSTILPYVKEKDVLEIGCGTGMILEKVRNLANSACGIDASEGMLVKAKNKGLNVRCNNATSIDYPSNSFDVIYSFKVLAHIPEIEKALSEMARLIRPEGRCILEFYNPYSIKCINNMLQGSKRKVYTRYDSSRRVKMLMGKYFHICSVECIRIAIPCAAVIRGKRSIRIFNWVENALKKTPMRHFAGYTVFHGKARL